MKVQIKFFASLREQVGAAEISKELAEGSAVEDLWKELQNEFPKLAPLKMTLLCAVNQDYVESKHILQDRDEVVFVPPVSGG
ncbi:MAG: molybdopterin converting factor subunit 1 [Candidatus Binatia bacterium]|jgi:molybdopterin synthase sulfur carrier subunit|nr:molybdopterin converting factor subunit 1 [Candidatus Binatia bacterium]